jgi:N-acetylneuraminic acid mutarotase
VAGLTGTVALADPGESNIAVTGNGTFSFPGAVAGGTPYSISIVAQPTGQQCSVANAAGTVSGNVTNISVSCVTLDEWTWVGGSQTVKSPGVYGTKGVAATGNVPGARDSQAMWIDKSGNVWLFGGWGEDADGNTGYLNDLWQYSPSTNEWTWEGGSSSIKSPGTYGTQGVGSTANIPGARQSATIWTDSSGNFWLFGGVGVGGAATEVGELEDLWEFSPASGAWTFVSGSQGVNGPGSQGTKGQPGANNLPGARDSAQGWIDQSGNLWVWGGFGYYMGETNNPIIYNDLWEYSLADKSWIMQGGAVLGTASGFPTGREAAVTWVDASGNFYVFGGSTRVTVSQLPLEIDDAYLSDMWEFNPSTLTWTFISGQVLNQTTGTTETNLPGNYGTEGVPAASNVPGARSNTVSWLDSQGNLWVFGGYGFDGKDGQGPLNDLWRYNVSSKIWTWMGGSETENDPGSFGTLGVPDVNNAPGARWQASGGIDQAGNVWLLGGAGVTPDLLMNDLWEYSLGH